MRECSCGSGNTKHALYDACGIFCTYVCAIYSNVEEQIDDDY